MSLEKSMYRHRLALVSWMSGINSMSSLSDVIPLILKDKLKSFLNLELDLEATCELNF